MRPFTLLLRSLASALRPLASGFRSLASGLWALTLAVGLQAQSVRWEPAGGMLGLGQVSQLTLVFDQCEPTGEIAFPNVAGLKFGDASRSEQSSFNLVNGRASRQHTVSYAYEVRPLQKGTVTIPSFQIQTDAGPLTTPAATFEIGDASIGQGRVSLASIAQAQFTLPPGQVWAGEVFPLSYSLGIARRYFYNIGTNLEWNPAPLSIEDWPKPEMVEATYNGEPRATLVYKTRALAHEAGAITLNQGSQIVILRTGVSGSGIFAQPTIEQVVVTTQPATLLVRPLPTPAPADFAGAVGQFNLTSKVVPLEVGVGEPITWTVTLEGSGNWPDLTGLPSRAVSKDFRVVQPKAQRTPKDNTLFDATLTEDVVLIPTQPGRYTLGPVKLNVFDPKTGRYRQLQTETFTVNVTAPVAPPPASATPAAAPSSGTPPSNATSTPSTVSPAAPAGIPRDPLPPASTAPTPLSATNLWLTLLAAGLWPLPFWFWLALRRARETDPARLRREARARIHATLTRFDAMADAAERSALVLQWQRDTALLWGFTRAVPTPAGFGADTTWATLWADSERLLYAGANSGSADWSRRAAEAAAAYRVPRFSALRTLRPSNLFPFIALLVLVSGFVLPSSFGASPSATAAYDRGDFVAAEESWRAALKANPTAWTAHHNLALALAQQDRWHEAAGHALAAFVQHPADPSVQWHLKLTLTRAGYEPAAIKGFLRSDPLYALAALASAAEWQRFLIATVALLALGAFLLLVRAYLPAQRWAKPTGLLTLMVALVGLIAGITSLHLYGPLANTEIALVWRPSTLRSIPTEADTTQKTSPLAAGSIATVDKPFLGWRRLVFENGQTGWVRAEDLVPLWTE